MSDRGVLVGTSALARPPHGGRPDAAPGLPPYVGLCPVHVGEFYMPLDAPRSQACPELGCPESLTVYGRLTYG